MATCESLQPVVVLNDVMSTNTCEIELIFDSKQEDNHQLFQMEQTEPLNLCLNESGNLNEEKDDDVIFVKEYPVNTGKIVKRCNGQKLSKSEPRRNPVRKARDIKRFKEYAHVNFCDEDDDEDEEKLFAECTEEENIVNLPEKTPIKPEDVEDWKIEDAAKKPRQKRKIITKKQTHRVGRKRKFHKTKQDKEDKVTLKDLESLIQSNLLLIRDYIYDVKEVKKILEEKEPEKRDVFQDTTTNAINVFKQQIILLSVVKEIDVSSLSSHIKEWISL